MKTQAIDLLLRVENPKVIILYLTQEKSDIPQIYTDV
jgi:hypothetical protein